jgi:ATP-dependent DNA ligase
MFVPGVKIPLPLGFIPPCLPSPSRKPPSRSAWVHEIKHDGYRLMARRDGNRVRLYTRRGYDCSAKYPWIVEALRSFESPRTAFGSGGHLLAKINARFGWLLSVLLRRSPLRRITKPTGRTFDLQDHRV